MEYDIRDYQILKTKLGKGSSATVFLGIHKPTGKYVAIKKYEVTTSSLRKKAEKEIRILKQCHHPHIIKLYDVYKYHKYNDIYLFLEYCKNKNIKQYLGKGGYLSEHEAKHLLRQLRDAMFYLYKKNIYHRDIKPQNILLNSQYDIKLIDFGLSLTTTKCYSNKLCGSPLYMAPEIIRHKLYTKVSDLWSFGIVMFEMLYGYNPFHKKTTFYDFSEYIKTNFSILPTKQSQTLSKDALDLMHRLLEIEYIKRISWEDFYDHSFFTHSNAFSLDFSTEQQQDNLEMKEEEMFQLLQRKPKIIRMTPIHTMFKSFPTQKKLKPIKHTSCKRRSKSSKVRFYK